MRIELVEPVGGGGYRAVIHGDIGTRRKGGEAGGGLYLGRQACLSMRKGRLEVIIVAQN